METTEAKLLPNSMATGNESSSSLATIEKASEEVIAKAVQKRYEGLMMVRTKAIKGKGAWYWAHLEPILVHSSDSGEPKAVKLRCSLCDTVFSASNPSRTASEHLKRGTCPNFSNPSAATVGAIHPQPKPLSSRPRILASSQNNSHNKRSSANNFKIAPITLVDPFRFHSPTTTSLGGNGDVLFSFSDNAPPPPQQQHLMLSGGKDDFGSLIVAEERVKKLKSLKDFPSPVLSKEQVDYALSLLSDWIFESASKVSLSSLEHPKFRAFLHQVGLPPISSREIAGSRLDSRYEEAVTDADARIRDALFFQVAAEGWNSRSGVDGDDSVVSLCVNLPNGSTVFRRSLVTYSRIPPKYAEEVLWDTVTDVCGGSPFRCAGIVSDRFKSSALLNLESQNHWMVNLACQVHGFRSLIKEFSRSLPLFHNIASKFSQIATFFNKHYPARVILRKHQTPELDRTGLFRSANIIEDGFFSMPDLSILEDMTASSRSLHLAVHDEGYKLLCLENREAREVAETVQDTCFLNDLDAAHSLVKLIGHMVREMETERPLVGQCLPLWEELRSKIKEWCSQYSIDEACAKKVFDRSFKRNYHPAWSAAFILDPRYLIKEKSGKYLPPYKCLTPEQEKDVDKLVTRLVSREEAPIVLSELMKWRTEGMDPLYAQAVQEKQLNPATGKMRMANPRSSRLVWETRLSEEFGKLGKVAARLIFLHATAAGFRCNSSLRKWIRTQRRSRAGMDRVQKMIFVAAHSRLERGDFSGDDDGDGDLFANDDVDVGCETFIDTSSV